MGRAVTAMSTTAVTWYVAICDECCRRFGDTDYELDAEDQGPYRATRDEATGAALDSGWTRTGKTLALIACPECTKCEQCRRQPAWTHGGRTRCEDHPHHDAEGQLHLTIDASVELDADRISGTATFTPAALDGKFIEWAGPVHIPTPHDILWYLDMGDGGYVVQCRCKRWFTGDDENAAREEHAAHVDRATRHAGQDPVLHHAPNPYLPPYSKGHNRLDLIEIDGQPARSRAWWRRLLLWR